VLVLLLETVQLQDMAGPVQVMAEATDLGAPYRLVYCGLASRVRSGQGLSLSDLQPLPEPEPGDLVLVPGVAAAALDALEVPRDWLRLAQQRGARLASICSGAFVLARAGLLDGRNCTTHWTLTARLAAEHPRAKVIEDRLFVEDGSVMTSAGIASGIDLSLALVEQDHGT
jgi:transcriptional regulator GlxA family with amidase domain